MTRNRFPLGWDEKRVRRVLAHYENQSDEAAAAEDAQAFKDKRRTVVEVPVELLPVIRGLIELVPGKRRKPHVKKSSTKVKKPRADTLEAP